MKKAKLFLSICTLCLCFAVLCMGIYAAQTVTYTISGTISYTVEDVFATISAKVFKVSGKQDADTMKTNVDTLASKSLSSIADTTYIDANISIADFDTTSSDTPSRTVAITIDNTYMTYYIVINISNSASVAINAQLTDTTTYTNLNKASKLIQNNIAKGDTKNLVVAFSLADNKVGIDSLEINYSIEVGYDLYYSKTFAENFLKEDTEKGYYYTELGTLSDSSTPIRWRLVSLDGTSKYVYEPNNTPKKHDGAIFLQETYLGSTVAFDADANQNYYESDIRTTINTLSTWNLQDSNVSSLITKRNITGIEAYCVDGTNYYNGTTSDYFWLMSDDEVKTYLGTENSDRIWTPNNNGTSAVHWWLRTPNRGSTWVSRIGDDGRFYCNRTSDEYPVRAAFQLA